MTYNAIPIYVLCDDGAPLCAFIKLADAEKEHARQYKEDGSTLYIEEITLHGANDND